MKKLALLLVLVLTLCACAPATPVLDNDTTTKFTNDGCTFSVPNEYVDLLVVKKGTDGHLFSFYEKASWEAGKVVYGHEGCGILLIISRMSEAEYQEELEVGVGYPTLLATDSEGQHYVATYPEEWDFARVDQYGNLLPWQQLYNHPDIPQWEDLNQWAWEASKDFADDNPTLRKVSELENLLRMGDAWEWEFTVQKGGDAWRYHSDGPTSSTYLHQLWKDVTFTPVTDRTFDPGTAYIAFRKWDRWDSDSSMIVYIYTAADCQNLLCVQPGYYDEERNDYFYDVADREYYALTKDGKPFNAGKVATDWWNAIKQ